MNPKIFLVFLIVVIFSCSKATKNSTNSTTQSDTLKPKVSNNSDNSYKMDTILKDDNVIILGDTSKHVANAISYVAIRFKPYIRFSDFKVDTLKNAKKAPIQYSSNPTARQFRTVITFIYRNEGLNFAGHYCFVQWGCGSPCQESALVDLNTGIVYDGVGASLGYDYREDSRMLIVNPPDSTGFYLNCPYCEPFIYVWNDKTKKFEER